MILPCLNWSDLASIEDNCFADYSKQLIDALSQTDPFDIYVDGKEIKEIQLSQEFAASSHTIEPFTLRTHSLKVLSRCFEQSFYYDISDILLFNHFALHLALHDMGKNLAVIHAGHKRHQHRFTVPIVAHICTILDLGLVLPLITNLINMDPIGDFLKGHMSGEATYQKILEASNLAQLSPKNFYRVLFFYYICDASSYQNLMKRIFKKEPSGKIVLQEDHLRLKGLRILEQSCQ
jgi:hypothetical protein